MIFRKNLPAWERWARALVGLAIALGGILWRGGDTIGIASVVLGASLALTGLVGFCPACALAGRRPQNPGA